MIVAVMSLVSLIAGAVGLVVSVSADRSGSDRHHVSNVRRRPYDWETENRNRTGRTEP